MFRWLLRLVCKMQGHRPQKQSDGSSGTFFVFQRHDMVATRCSLCNELVVIDLGFPGGM